MKNINIYTADGEKVTSVKTNKISERTYNRIYNMVKEGNALYADERIEVIDKYGMIDHNKGIERK